MKTSNFSSNRPHRLHSGFTLLEMVLVVFIMGTLATVSLTFIENEDAQWRYDESINKMKMIREAVVKVRDYNNEERLSGFVFDNGVLPPLPSPSSVLQVKPLIEKDDSWSKNTVTSVEWEDYGLQIPTYKNDTSTFPLTGSEFNLFKGYRNHYLPSSSLDSDEEFLDAWGLPFGIANTTNTYQFSLENNYATGVNKIEGFTTPLNYEVSPDDWSIPIEQLRFSIENKTSAGIDVANYQIALLIYLNTKDSSNKWKTYYFNPILPSTIGIDATELFGPGGNSITWKQNKNPITSFSRIPVGRHIVAIFSESPPDGTTTLPNTIKDNTQILISARSSIPTIKFVIE